MLNFLLIRLFQVYIIPFNLIERCVHEAFQSDQQIICVHVNIASDG